MGFRPWLLVALVGCGPSFQAVYEGNARFEHCYALEENPQVAMPQKATCWREWSEHYTYGQTRDRIHYATARYVALTEAREIPTDEALMMAAPGETPRRSSITAPAPTNAFAPPPKTLDQSAETKTTSAMAPLPTMVLDAGPPPAPLPAAACTDTCGGAYKACGGNHCEGDAGASSSTSSKCVACQKTYRTCMRGCFK